MIYEDETSSQTFSKNYETFNETRFIWHFASTASYTFNTAFTYHINFMTIPTVYNARIFQH